MLPCHTWQLPPYGVLPYPPWPPVLLEHHFPPWQLEQSDQLELSDEAELPEEPEQPDQEKLSEQHCFPWPEQPIIDGEYPMIPPMNPFIAMQMPPYLFGDWSTLPIYQPPVHERVWELSRHPQGSRHVQTAFDESVDNQERAYLASKLHGHVLEAIKCQHANHVLQKCITIVPPQELQFIIDELRAAGPGSVSKAARHPYGCRILQRLQEHCSRDQVEALLEDMLDELPSLFKHKYGHFVIQHFPEEHAERIKDALKKDPPRAKPSKVNSSIQAMENEPKGDPMSIRSHVWSFARDEKKCWWVQTAFDELERNDDRKLLASELEGHVWEAIRCPNANHVLQKCISTMAPQDSQFIIDELQAQSGSVNRAARHTNGCRILKRLLEHCSPDMVRSIVEELLEDAATLCKHKYANFVMQHLLEHGTAEQITKLEQVLVGNVAAIAEDSFGCAVLSKALDASTDRAAFAKLVLAETALSNTACSRHGHHLVEAALEHADLHSRAAALVVLKQDEEILKKSRYGRAVINFVKNAFKDDSPTFGV